MTLEDRTTLLTELVESEPWEAFLDLVSIRAKSMARRILNGNGDSFELTRFRYLWTLLQEAYHGTGHKVPQDLREALGQE
jgi:hypothetical protein